MATISKVNHYWADYIGRKSRCIVCALFQQHEFMNIRYFPQTIQTTTAHAIAATRFVAHYGMETCVGHALCERNFLTKGHIFVWGILLVDTLLSESFVFTFTRCIVTDQTNTKWLPDPFWWSLPYTTYMVVTPLGIVMPYKYSAVYMVETRHGYLKWVSDNTWAGRICQQELKEYMTLHLSTRWRYNYMSSD